MARFFNPFNQFFNGSGRLLPGAKLYFYQNGTTTPQDTFSDAALTTPNTNPVICNDDGRVPEIFMGDATIYSVTLTDTNDVQIAQVDDYTGADSAVTSAEVLAALAANTVDVVINGPTVTLGGNLKGDGGFTSNPAAGQFSSYGSTTLGGVFAGNGSTNDVTFQNSSGANAANIPAGTTNFNVVGALSKGSGSFRISHPLMPETHELVHSFVESPRAENLYSGMSQLENGSATVNLDAHSGMTEGTYEALNHTRSWSSSNESGYDAVKCSVSGNILTIECENPSSNDTVYFEVRGERKDQHMLDTAWTDDEGRVIVEPEKN